MDAPTQETPAPIAPPDSPLPVAAAPLAAAPTPMAPDTAEPQDETAAGASVRSALSAAQALLHGDSRSVLHGDSDEAERREARSEGVLDDPLLHNTPSPAELETALSQLERLCGRLEQAESRFKQLTDECEGVLKGLVAVDRRHSSALASLNDRLGDWCHLESKLLEESARRIEQFERGVGHEWMVLRQLHEEPLVQLKDDADQLRMACLEAARTARHRFDSVEKAYTSYAAELDHRLSEWSRELLGAVANAAAGKEQPAALPAPSSALAVASSASVEPWPLEGVAQLHHEIRTGTPAPPAPTASPAADPPAAPRLTRKTILLFGSLVLLVAALGGYAMLRSTARVATPAAPAAAPATPAVSRDAAGVPAAGRGSRDAAVPDASATSPGDRVDEAQRAAERAGTMVDILAAADLRRYALGGVSPTTPNQPYGQVLWSRSRGLAASASRLPSPPAGKVYRLWIVPDGPPVSAGVLATDAAGRATLLVPGPLTLPVPVTIRVTLEDKGETAAPRGPVCLVRVPGA